MIPKDFKPQRGLGQAVTRQRRRLNKELRDEAQRREDRERRAASQELNDSRYRADAQKQQAQMNWVKAIIGAGVSQSRAVIASTGITIPSTGAMPRIHSRLAHSHGISAWTDFKSIHANWPMHVYELELGANGVTNRFGAEVHSSVKGVIYHEFGHIQFTVPWPSLVDARDENMILPTSVGALKYAWNLLEDQRMEAAVIADAPIKAVYFKQMMLKYIVSPTTTSAETGDFFYRLYPLVAGRAYLPAKLVSDIRKAFVTSQGADKADMVDEIVRRYMTATDATTMVQAVIDMHALLDFIAPDRSHDNHGDGVGGESMDKSEVEESLQESASDSPSQGSPADADESDEGKGEKGSSSAPVDDVEVDDESESSGGNESDDDEGESDGDESDEGEGDGEGDAEGGEDEGDAEGDAEGGESGDSNPSDEMADTHDAGSHQGSATPSWSEIQDQVNDLLNETLDEIIRNDDGVTDALTYANEARDRLPELDGSDFPEFDPADSELVAVGVERALSDFVTASAPVWQTHQEEGTLVPIDFRTRSVGDSDYYTHLKGAGNVGIDLHVSFLADVSMSMNADAMLALSKSMYATAVACDRLDIPTTFTVWSDGDDQYRVWNDGNYRPTIWPALGGTDPYRAMDDCDSHNEMGKSHHLILIFTDGEWGYGFGSLQRWAREGRTIAVVRYTPYRVDHNYNPNDADYMLPISDIGQVPDQLTFMIQQIMGS